MHAYENYVFDVPDIWELLKLAERVQELVWRFDFSAPGFCVVDMGADVPSKTFRAGMIALKDELSKINVQRGLPPIAFRSVGRFDAQVTTKFHLDGAPEQSLLILGYEPSNVPSRLFLADYTRAAFDQQMTVAQFLNDYNPMYRPGEELLEKYTTELPRQRAGVWRLVVVNNSSLDFSTDRTNPLGVMHKAVIDALDPAQSRVLNSMMLVAGLPEEVEERELLDFMETDKITQRLY